MEVQTTLVKKLMSSFIENSDVAHTVPREDSPWLVRSSGQIHRVKACQHQTQVRCRDHQLADAGEDKCPSLIQIKPELVQGMPAVGTLPNARNGICLELNWTAIRGIPLTPIGHSGLWAHAYRPILHWLAVLSSRQISDQNFIPSHIDSLIENGLRVLN